MRWGKADFKELEKLKERVEDFSDSLGADKFYKDCCHELAARLLALVIPRTPVGKYPKSSGKKGGALRRGWTGGKDSKGSVYAKSLQVSKQGSNYVIEIRNPVEYASYVEFGHRTRGGSGWVEGRYMLTISENMLESASPAILEKLLKKKLKEIFNG